MKSYRLLLIMTLCLPGVGLFAQSGYINLKDRTYDYLITSTNDTLLGKVKRNSWEHKNEVTLETDKGKTRYHFDDVKEFRTSKITIVIQKGESSARGRIFYRELLVDVEGKVRLLRDGHYDFNPPYYVYLNGQYIATTSNNLIHHIWPALLKCPMFAQTYGHVTNSEVGRWNKKVKKLSEAITYYNRHCQ